APTRIRRRFGLSDVNRPIERQRNFAEHSAHEPAAIPVAPKVRRGSSLANVFEIFAIADLESRDSKRGHGHGVKIELVIPAESVATRAAEFGDAGRDVHQGIGRRRTWRRS